MFPRHPELITADIMAHQAELRREAARARLARVAQRTAPRPHVRALLQRLGRHLGLTPAPVAQQVGG